MKIWIEKGALGQIYPQGDLHRPHGLLLARAGRAHSSEPVACCQPRLGWGQGQGQKKPGPRAWWYCRPANAATGSGSDGPHAGRERRARRRDCTGGAALRDDAKLRLRLGRVVTLWCYCSSYIISIVFIQWWLQYKPNLMKMIFSINRVGSFWVNLKVWIFELLRSVDH
jgi:hypothetical protein